MHRNRFILAAISLVVFATTTAAWETYRFDLPSNVKESAWRDALAKRLNGQAEVAIEGGRIDVLTDTMAIEVDWPHKWHEGLGQALHYADATGKQGAVALIAYSQDPENLYERSRKRLEMVERLYAQSNIKLLVLFPSRPRQDDDSDDEDGDRGDDAQKPRFQYWLNSKTGIRHNANCRYYENTAEGYPCGPDEGEPCSLCGG
jgi:hypothetical protein